MSTFIKEICNALEQTGFRLVRRTSQDLIFLNKKDQQIRILNTEGPVLNLSVHGFPLSDILSIDQGIIQSLTSRNATKPPINKLEWLPEQWRTDTFQFMNLKAAVLFDPVSFPTTLDFVFQELSLVQGTIETGKKQIAKQLSQKSS